MSKYYKAEDVTELINACEWRMTLAKERHGEGFVDYSKQVLDVEELSKRLSTLPTIEVSEENELKFYYVESTDDYWIGQRVDNFYYAEWNDRLGFVWTHSRYLPWGEHVVAPDTLWKEHTYPSEPKEIPFTEWIVGFMKKHSVVPNAEVSEDCISRAWVQNKLTEYVKDYALDELDSWQNTIVEWIATDIEDAPSVVSQPKEGEWIRQGISPHEGIPLMPKVNEVEFEVCDVSVEMVVVDSEDGKVPVRV